MYIVCMNKPHMNILDELSMGAGDLLNDIQDTLIPMRLRRSIEKDDDHNLRVTKMLKEYQSLPSWKRFRYKKAYQLLLEWKSEREKILEKSTVLGEIGNSEKLKH